MNIRMGMTHIGSGGGRVLSPLQKALSQYELDLVSGTIQFRKDLLASAGFTFTRGSSAFQINGDGTFTSVGNDVPCFGPDGLQSTSSYTNIQSYNCDLSATYWTAWGTCTRTYTAAGGAWGDLPFTTLTADAGNGNHGCYRASPTLTGATTYTISAIAQDDTGARYLGIRSPTIGDGDVWIWAVYDLQAGTFQITSGANAVGGMIPLGNGMYHCWFRYLTKTTESGSFAVALYGNGTPNVGSGAPNFNGTGLTLRCGGVSVVGKIIPVLSPVVTTSSAVGLSTLRVISSITNLPASYTVSTKIKSYSLRDSTTSTYITQLDDLTSNNRIVVYGDPSASAIYTRITNAGVTQVIINVPVTYPETFAPVVRVDTNNVRFAIGSTLSSLGSAVTLPTPTTIRICSAIPGANEFSGFFQKVQNPNKWRPALNDTDLQALSNSL